MNSVKPLSNQHSYATLVKTTKTFLLLLSGGLSLFILILLLQLFSYFGQPGNSNNNSSSDDSQTSQMVTAASMVATAVTKHETNNDGEKSVYKETSVNAKNIEKTALRSSLTMKHTASVKAEKSFLKVNDRRNNEIVKELSEVVEMHEFHFKHRSFQLAQNANMDKLDSSIQKCIAEPESWTKIIVLGFTDNRGSQVANIKLGMKRAAMLKAILVKKGIPADKITVASFGSELPIGSNRNEAGRALNRRVEFNLVGTGS